MFSIDLKNAKFQFPTHPESCPYLQFSLNRSVFQFKALFHSFHISKDLHEGILPSIVLGSQKGGYICFAV